MGIITIILLLLFTNLITFTFTLIKSKKIIHKIEMEVSKLMFKKIISNAEKKANDVDNLTFNDIFKEE